MQREQRLNPEDAQVERALSALRPLTPAFAVDSIATFAELRSGRRELRLWRGVAAALAAGLVISLVLRPSPRTVEKFVYLRPTGPAGSYPAVAPGPVPDPKRAEPMLVLSGDDYLSVRSRVLVFGLQTLRSSSSGAAQLPLVHAFDTGDMTTGSGAHPVTARPGSDGTSTPSFLNLLNPLGHGDRS